MRIIGLACLLGLALGSISQAASIFSTGVDNVGAPLALGSIDPHYSRSGVGGPNVIVTNPSYPFWLANSSRSQWVDDTGSRSLAPTESFFTTFAGSGLGDSLDFAVAVDNNVLDILLNNSSINYSLTCNCSGNFTVLHNVHIDASTPGANFLLGTNTLEFRVQNVSEIGAFRVESVPEPGSMALIALGGLFFSAGAVRRKWKAGIADRTE